MPLSYDELVAQPERVDEMVAALDPAGAADRRSALDAMCTLVERVIVPAAGWLAESKDVPGHRYFDLQRIARSDFSGLALGLLAESFPALMENPPDDETLREALDDIGFEIDGAERRASFFRAWMAQRAAHVVRALLRVVEEGRSGDSSTDAAEIEELKRLLDAPLPGLEHQLLEEIVTRRSKRAASS